MHLSVRLRPFVGIPLPELFVLVPTLVILGFKLPVHIPFISQVTRRDFLNLRIPLRRN